MARRFLAALLLGGLVWWPSHQGYWWVSLGLIVAAEMVMGPRSDGAHTVSNTPINQKARLLLLRDRCMARLPAILMAGSLALIISLFPKAISQISFTAAYVVWRFVYGGLQDKSDTYLVGLFLVQAAFFEAVFLAAAFNNPSPTFILLMIWLGCFGLSYGMLELRGERNVLLMASVWALVAAECSWIFSTWLVSYVTIGGYITVPQPALVLSAIAYCFGGIYMAQRQNRLSRARLSEYLFIAVIILAIVIAGTKWRGSL